MKCVSLLGKLPTENPQLPRLEGAHRGVGRPTRGLARSKASCSAVVRAFMIVRGFGSTRQGSRLGGRRLLAGTDVAPTVYTDLHSFPLTRHQIWSSCIGLSPS